MTEVSHIFRWDLDKTYLATEFDTPLDLWRTFRQSPEEKRNVPGADALLRAILRPVGSKRRVVTFISGSPREMREVLTKKLKIDGIEPQHFVLKPNLSNLLKGRFRAIRGQVGYKLGALFKLRSQGELAVETLFGDDAEADAFVYNLYADVVAGRVDCDLLANVLRKAKVYEDTADEILAMVKSIEQRDTVQRIVINLARDSPTGTFKRWGERTVCVHNYFQAASILCADSVLAADDVLTIGVHMNRVYGFSSGMLANSLVDLIRRGRLEVSWANDFVEALPQMSVDDVVSADMLPGHLAARISAGLSRLMPAQTAAVRSTDLPDYLKLARHHAT